MGNDKWFIPVRRLVNKLSHQESKHFQQLLETDKRTISNPLALFNLLRKEVEIDRETAFKKFKKGDFQTALEGLRDRLIKELPRISENKEQNEIQSFNQKLDSLWELCDRGGFELANDLFFKLFRELKENWKPEPRNFFLYSRMAETHSKLLSSGPWEEAKVSQIEIWKDPVLMFASSLASDAGKYFTSAPKAIPKLEDQFQKSLLFQMMKNAMETPELLAMICYHRDKPRVRIDPNKLVNATSISVLHGIKFLDLLEGLYLSYARGEKQFFDQFWAKLQHEAIYKQDLRLAEFAYFQLQLWDIQLRYQLRFSIPDEATKVDGLVGLTTIRWKALIEDEIVDIPVRIEFNKAVLLFCNGDFEKSMKIFKELVRDKGTVKKIQREYCDLYILICDAMMTPGKFSLENWKDDWKKVLTTFNEMKFEKDGLDYLFNWATKEDRKPKFSYDGPILPDPDNLSHYQYPLFYWLKNLHINNGYTAH